MAQRIARILLRTVLILFILMIVLLLVFDRLVQFRMDDKEVRTYFEANHTPVSIRYYQTHDRTMRYISTGSDTSATVLFVHGAPSSSTYFRDYLTDSLLLGQATLYAVDRPGYGYSGLADPVTSIQTQAAMIRPILDSLQKIHHPVVLVGASYGTSVVCRIAMDYPELVDGIVLVAPALAPGEEKIYWFTPMIESPVFHWFIPRMFKTANIEKITHKSELEKMLPLWKNIHAPVNYIQGSQDKLVYTTNAAFAQAHLVNSPHVNVQFIPKRGHLIAFLERERIRNSILDMLQRVKHTKADE
ncbi:alpha/beta fold hydrolase [Deminuibacter soli]|uniref:Alpha/beta hydrolase n=1 Tax=Deminuibacter soli TaxID=2291815 RepID=A0A3E1NR39_9BACT|nr:alpha/beta hydrolase [Deminuibacter soli]RFM30401.1 alpha/beta hydrolase [Deminuibacter soli]